MCVRWFRIWRSRLWPNERAQETLDALDGHLALGIHEVGSRLNRALRQSDAVATAAYRRALQELLNEADAARALRTRAYEALLAERPVSLPGDRITYWISSTTLAQAYAYLTQALPTTGEEPEWMLAATGIHVGNIRTLETLVEIKLEMQSIGGASFDMSAFRRVAQHLYAHGQALHAVLHSHPTRGHPHPSQTDWRLQRILEQGGYPAIQAVFSRDGYVQFYAKERRFTVKVDGKGAQHVLGKEGLFHISERGALPNVRTWSECIDGRNDVRPLPADPRR